MAILVLVASTGLLFLTCHAESAGQGLVGFYLGEIEIAHGFGPDNRVRCLSQTLSGLGLVSIGQFGDSGNFSFGMFSGEFATDPANGAIQVRHFVAGMYFDAGNATYGRLVAPSFDVGANTTIAARCAHMGLAGSWLTISLCAGTLASGSRGCELAASSAECVADGLGRVQGFCLRAAVQPSLNGAALLSELSTGGEWNATMTLNILFNSTSSSKICPDRLSASELSVFGGLGAVHQVPAMLRFTREGFNTTRPRYSMELRALAQTIVGEIETMAVEFGGPISMIWFSESGGAVVLGGGEEAGQTSFGFEASLGSRGTVLKLRVCSVPGVHVLQAYDSAVARGPNCNDSYSCITIRAERAPKQARMPAILLGKWTGFIEFTLLIPATNAPFVCSAEVARVALAVEFNATHTTPTLLAGAVDPSTGLEFPLGITPSAVVDSYMLSENEGGLFRFEQDATDDTIGPVRCDFFHVDSTTRLLTYSFVFSGLLPVRKGNFSDICRPLTSAECEINEQGVVAFASFVFKATRDSERATSPLVKPNIARAGSSVAIGLYVLLVAVVAFLLMTRRQRQRNAAKLADRPEYFERVSFGRQVLVCHSILGLRTRRQDHFNVAARVLVLVIELMAELAACVATPFINPDRLDSLTQSSLAIVSAAFFSIVIGTTISFLLGVQLVHDIFVEAGHGGPSKVRACVLLAGTIALFELACIALLLVLGLEKVIKVPFNMTAVFATWLSQTALSICVLQPAFLLAKRLVWRDTCIHRTGLVTPSPKANAVAPGADSGSHAADGELLAPLAPVAAERVVAVPALAAAGPPVRNASRKVRVRASAVSAPVPNQGSAP